MADKTYSPETTTINNLPGEVDMSASGSRKISTGVYSPEEIPFQPLGSQIVASDVVNDNINTQFKTIGGDFQMLKGGSLKDNTQTVFVDEKGVNSLNTFYSAQLTGNTEISTSSTSMVDIADGVLGDLVLARSVKLLLFLFTYGKNDNFNSGSNAGEAQIYDSFLGTSTGVNVYFTGSWFTKVNWDINTGLINSTVERVSAQTESNIGIVTAAAGTHSYKIRYRASGAGTARLYNWRFGYVILGK